MKHLINLKWWCTRLYYRCRTFRDYAERLHRATLAESVLLSCAMGKRPLPTKEDCLKISIYLGVPDCYRTRENVEYVQQLIRKDPATTEKP